MQIFESFDAIIDLPYSAFEKKLTKLEEAFAWFSIDDIHEDSLDEYFGKIKGEFNARIQDSAKNRLAVLGYIAHFDVLVEKYFPDYVSIFQTVFEREDFESLAPVAYTFIEHLDEILRDYTHRLSDPDNYPSYTSYIQEVIRESMIGLFFWLQERETEQEKKGTEKDKNTDIAIKISTETDDMELRFIRQCLELLGEWVLEKIFFDFGYPIRTSPTHPDLQLIGRYQRKTTVH